MAALDEILSSKVKAQVFRLLFGGDHGLHLREIERRSGLAVGTVRQELERLTKLGLLEKHADGNRSIYSANRQHPIYPDIRNIVLKTSGIADELRAKLEECEGIRVAFIFGSVARGEERAESDIDLMVIGSIGLRKLVGLLRGMSEKTGREINPVIFTPEEFARRRKSGDHLLANVLSKPRSFIIGTDDELGAMAQ